MRILQLSWEYPPLVYGGLGRHVHALAEAEAALGHEVTVLTQHVEGAADDETVRGVRIIRVPYDPPIVPQSDLLAWVLGLGHAIARAGSRLGEQWRPDIVHAHDWLMCHAGTALKEAFGVGLVATMHATEAGRHQGWLPSPLSRAIHTTEWWLTFEARRVITCSPHMRWEVTRLFELPPDKVDLVANGIDRATWSVRASTAAAARVRYAGKGPLLVYAGRLEWEKGMHTLLEAMPRLRRRHPGLHLVVAGDGTFGAELRERAKAARLGPSVAFTGFLPREELAAVVAAADCAVVPSLYEPFGLAALEAAALGTPLVVSDVGGLREFARGGACASLVTPGDPAALAAGISLVLDDEVLARRLVRTARQRLGSNHSWPALAARTVDTYARAADEERVLQAGLSAKDLRPLHLAVRDGNLLTGDVS